MIWNDQADLIKECQEAVKIPGESGQEKEIAAFVKDLMHRLHYDQVHVDEVGNVIGLIHGDGDKRILMEGHMDTVGVDNPEGWDYDPYGGIVEDSKLYGRGASDMRSALVAMIYAAPYAAKRKKLKGTIAVAGTVCEEIFEGVAQGIALDWVNPDLVIIGEASNLNLCIGQRGRAEIQVTTYGKSVHSANPQEGINAVYSMMELLPIIKKIELPKAEPFGDAIMELTDIRSQPYPGRSVTPNTCAVTLDRRVLPGETKESVLRPIREAISRLEEMDSSFKGEVTIVRGEETSYTGLRIEAERYFPGWIVSEEEEFVKRAWSALQEENAPSKISYYSFCTNGSQSAGARGIPTIGFGPSKEILAHTVNEHIEIEQIIQAFQGYQGILCNLLS